MSWSCGYDTRWRHDIGYGVPARCDYPGCTAEIDRGIEYVCGGAAHGGTSGCGLFFCEDHRNFSRLCDRCETGKPPYEPSQDTAEWILWKLTDSSWAEWRRENPDMVAAMSADLS